MADACESTITPTLVTATGIAQTLVNGDSCGSKFAAGVNNIWMRATNSSTARSITFVNQVGGSPLVIPVPQTTGDITWAFDDLTDYLDAAGYVHFTYSAAPSTTLKVAVFRMPVPE